MFNQALMTRDDDEEFAKIFVGEPTKEASNIVYYKIFAYDLDGEFEAKRRYNDFTFLREAWQKRLTGLYIPSLPPKKYFVSSIFLTFGQGNTSKPHLQERSFHLEQFLRKIYKLPYLLASEEWKLFARYQPDEATLQQKLQFMPPQNTAMLAFRIKQATQEHKVSAHSLIPKEHHLAEGLESHGGADPGSRPILQNAYCLYG